MKKLVERFTDWIKRNNIFKNLSNPMKVLITTALTIFLTYSITTYLNRDIVKLQSVSVRPKEISLTVDRQLATKLSNLLNQSYFDRAQNAKLDLTTIDKDYIVESIKFLASKSGSISDKITEQTKIKSQINDIHNDSLSKEELSNINKLNNSFYDDDEDITYVGNSVNRKRKILKQQIIENVNRSIEKLTQEKNDIDGVVKSLAQKSKKALDENKDKFQIEIIAFNEGNQQTVIRHKGSLLLGQTQINLKKASTQKIEDYFSKLSKAQAGKYHQDGSSSNYLIIEPKSFIVMNLEIDKFNNKNRDIEVIKREYLSGQSKVELTLFDIKNNPIKPYSFLLQNDIEFDPNDELFKYISPFIEE